MQQQNCVYTQVLTSGETLDKRHVFLCDKGMKLYIWVGKKSHLVTRTKSRLV